MSSSFASARLRSLAVAVAAVAAVALAACGGGDPGLSSASWSHARAHAYCAKAFACCTTAYIQVRFGSSIADEATCETGLDQIFDVDDGPGIADAAHGKAVYDGDAAQRCVDAIGAQTCGEFANAGAPPSSCAVVFTGELVSGDACSDDVMCVGGFCGGLGTPQPACAAPATVGQACIDGRCAGGLFCDTTQATPTCAALIGDGAPCTDDHDCASGACGAQGCLAQTSCPGAQQ